MFALCRLIRCFAAAVGVFGLLLATFGTVPSARGQVTEENSAPPAATSSPADDAAATDANSSRDGALNDVLRRLAIEAAAMESDADRTVPAGDAGVTLTFSFRAQPWGDCLQWLADEADFSLVADHPPPGTCNYVDQRGYTPEEAIDVFNRLLLVKGYSLVRRGRMLWLLNLEDEIPPKLLPIVTPAELDGRGEFELVNVIFQFDSVTPEEVENEIAPLLGPYANPKRLEKSRQLWLTETAGRLRTIRRVIESMDNPGRGKAALKTYVVARTSPTTLQTLLTTMLEDVSNVKFSLDPTSGNLIALAPDEQHQVIRDLLIQLGESGQTVDSRLAIRTNLRVVPMSRSEQENALRAIRQMYGSRLRVVTPSAVAPPAGPSAAPEENNSSGGLNGQRSPLNRGRLILPSEPRREETRDPMAAAPGVSWTPVSQVAEADPAENDSTKEAPDDDAAIAPPDPPAVAEPERDDSGLTIATTPRGIVVHSDDLDLLDDVETFLRNFGGAGEDSAEHTFFYLRNAPAAVAAETIKKVIGGGQPSSGNELLGAGVYTGPPQINADERLNALIVKASPGDLRRIEELLQIIDQDGAPRTQISPQPRVIPVVYMEVEAMEEIVKATFAPDIFVDNSSRNDRDRRREDFFARMRGGGGDDGDRDGGGGGNSNDRNTKMTVTSDKVNNALIVSAPQALYEEVAQLVEMLDVGTPATAKTARVVTLHRTNAQSVQGALSAMFGDSVTSRTAAASEDSARNGSSNNGSRSDRDEDERRREEFRRRMEFFQRWRGGGDRGRGDSNRGR